MNKTTFNNNTFKTLATFLFLVVFVEAIFLFGGSLSSIFVGSHDQVLNKYARSVVSLCSEQRYHPACYDIEIPKLMDKISMEDAFKVTAMVQSMDSSYPYCHVLGHKLSAREVDKDPTKWKDVIARVPSGQCSNGGIHGAFQERFRKESFTPEEVVKVKPELMDICEKREGWNPTGLETGSCYHALGHLTMYMTKADIKTSLKLCDEIAKKPNGQDSSQLCYDGAFMQIFQPLEPEDFDLILGKEVKKGQLQSFCGKFNGKERSSCWSEGWPLVYDQIMTPEGMVKHCSTDFLQNKDDNDRCFLALQYVVTAQMKFDVVKLKNFCSDLPVSRSGDCFAYSASRMIENDYNNIPMSIKFCSEATRIEARDKCYKELVSYSTYNFHPGSKEFYSICNSLPEEWKKQCLSGV